VINKEGRALMAEETGKDKRMGTQAGKRYKCEKCGSEVLVTKPGNGTLKCCGQEMPQKQ
jgi:desulfoferrodoxin-like iron-binding protein